MYKMKVVNYVTIKQDDRIHWQTKILDFQNCHEPVHTMYNELRIQMAKQAKYLTNSAENGHTMLA